MSVLIGANVEFKLVLEENTVEFAFDISGADILKAFIIKSSKQSIQNSLESFFEAMVGKSIFKFDFSLVTDSIISLFITQAIEKIFFLHNPSFSTLQKTLSADEIVCRCFGVGSLQIKDAIKNGAVDLLSVTNITKASGGCGSCRGDIENLIGTVKHDIVVNENNFDSTFYAALSSKFAKYPRELINGKSPLKFLQEDVFPMAKRDGFEVLGLVEKNLYIKSQFKQIGFENFLLDSSIELSIFYS